MCSNYPPGAANDPNAPYNQHDIPEKDFEVIICQSLSKVATVTTSDYNPIKECDEDGYYCYDDTSETNWSQAYKESCYDCLELINELKDITDTILANWDNFKDYIAKPWSKIYRINEDCQGWQLDDSEVLYE